jgi:hypothetical protein
MSNAKPTRPPRPSCLCGCGELTSWGGPARGWTKFARGCYQRRRIPPHPPWIDTDPEFWAWFAGFADGEGCFGVIKSRTGGRDWPQPFFKIAVRADERPILEEIRDRLGCGRVSVHVPGGTTSNLQLKFELTSLSDCERLVEVLTAHPLRAKKRQDFETWSQLIAEKAANGATPRVWELREKLIAGRRYDPRIAKGGDAE